MRLAVAIAIAAVAWWAATAGVRLSGNGCAVAWSVAPSAVVYGAELRAVAADAPDDAWAVGGPSSFESGPRPKALIEHWDGGRWSVAASPSVSALLEGVAVTGRSDAWAVGERTDSSGEIGAERGLGAVVEHWDGKDWRGVPMPGLQRLSAVAATSATDAWTVGVDANGGAVVLHWDGSGWQTRLRRTGAELLAVAALSPYDVWAVGDQQSLHHTRFLEVHWNGTRWSSYSQPSPNGGYGADPEPQLVGIGAAGENDIWAAGEADNSGEPTWADTVLFHWTGNTWRKALTPGGLWVSAVAARTAGELWIAGIGSNGDAYGQPKLERRIGSAWQHTWLPGGERIDSLAGDQQHGLWAVGFVGTWLDAMGFPTHTHSLIKRAHCS